VITQNIVDEALRQCGNKRIVDVRAGLGYTCVLLSDGGCGLAYTFRNDLGACCGNMNSAGKLIGMNAEEVIPWLMEDNRLKAAIGLATANAVQMLKVMDTVTSSTKSQLMLRIHLV